MKLMIGFLTIAATLAVCSLPALAQAKECNDEFKTATYQKWYDNRKTDQAAAYQAAQEYLTVCPTDDSPYSTALKKFADAYKKANESVNTKNQFEEAYAKKNWVEAVKLGKQVAQAEPDYVRVFLLTPLAAYNAAIQPNGDAALLTQTSDLATKAIEMVEGGKDFKPFTSKDSAVAWMNYEIGKSKLKTAPADAIPNFLKAARLEPDLKKSPGLYIDLASAYGEGPIAKLTEEYKAKYTGQNESPESKLALANIYQMIDRQIDALARAVALASGAEKTTYLNGLTEIYKDRNKGADTGLNELVASVLSKPLPDFPSPLTSLPATATPSSTPAGNSSTSGSNGTNGQANSASTTGKPKPRQ